MNKQIRECGCPLKYWQATNAIEQDGLPVTPQPEHDSSGTYLSALEVIPIEFAVEFFELADELGAEVRWEVPL